MTILSNKELVRKVNEFATISEAARAMNLPRQTLTNRYNKAVEYLREHKREPCPWCKSKAESYTNGSYVEGWISFVECSDFECGARGPKKQTGGMSNDERITEDQAIEAWNTVVKNKE